MIRAGGSMPAIRATRSECRPAQLTRYVGATRRRRWCARRSSPCGLEPGDPGAEAQRRAGLLQQRRPGSRRRRRSRRCRSTPRGCAGDAGDVRLELAGLVRRRPVGTGSPLASGPLVQRAQPGQLGRARWRRSACRSIWCGMPCSRQKSTIEALPARHSVGLEAAGLVVDARRG